MHFKNDRRNIPSFSDPSEFDESTDPGLDRMATQYVVDPNSPPVGDYPAPYKNVRASSNIEAPRNGFAGQTPQLAPSFNGNSGPFQKVPSGFIPSDQVSGELSSSGFQRPQNTTGTFGQISSAGMMSPGFQQPQNTTGTFGQISSAGMMSPGFQQPPLQNRPISPELNSKVAIRYALVTGGCGAILGLILGILNTLMQGWQINQGTPQTLILVGLFAAAFAAVSYFRRERVDELLKQAKLTEVIEFLNHSTNIKQAIHPTIGSPTGSFQPPADVMYRNSPSGTFRTPDPDSTDEIEIR